MADAAIELVALDAAVPLADRLGDTEALTVSLSATVRVTLGDTLAEADADDDKVAGFIKTSHPPSPDCICRGDWHAAGKREEGS